MDTGLRLPPGDSDDVLLKFTTAGKFVLQIGHRNSSGGNADTRNLHQPADSFLNSATNEIFVADGYANHRVIVFDAGTAAFKRMWGAFANKPETAPAAGESVRAEGPPQVWYVSLTVRITLFRSSRLTGNTSRKNLSARWDRLLPALHSRLMPGNDCCMSRI
jgi:hypothetical protein